MNLPLDSLKQQREQVLEQMRAIDQLRRGTLSRQYLKKHRGAQTLTHGPYFVLQGYLHGRKFSQHVPATDAIKVGEQVKNYKRFQELAEDFVSLTDRITQWEEHSPDSKKNSGRKKSPTNGTERPKRS
jgi:hypothetical protein